MLACCAASPAASGSILEKVLSLWTGQDLAGVFLNVSTTVAPSLPDPVVGLLPATIDGSISNTIYGALASFDLTRGVFGVDRQGSIGNFDAATLQTIGIGGVNTGLIDLAFQEQIPTPGVFTGLNASTVAAMAGNVLSRSSDAAVIGGNAYSTALTLNLASSSVAVSGRVDTVLVQVESAIGSIDATAIGAVNTGGIQAGIESTLAALVGNAGL